MDLTQFLSWALSSISHRIPASLVCSAPLCLTSKTAGQPQALHLLYREWRERSIPIRGIKDGTASRAPIIHDGFVAKLRSLIVRPAQAVGSGGSLSPRSDYRAPSDGEATVWLSKLDEIPDGEMRAGDTHEGRNP